MSQKHGISRRKFLRLSAMAAGGVVLAACGGSTATNTPSASQPAASPTMGASPQPSPPGASPTAAMSPQPSPPGASPTPAASPSASATPGTSSGVPNVPYIATPVTYQGEYKEAPSLAELVKAGKLPPVEQRLPKNPYVVPHKWVQQGKYGGKIEMLNSSSDDWGTTHFIQESMYGHSPLRYLNDGLTIGPGLAESWESNEDATVWTFHFREGLKWSDGHPWTVDDILFWWEDMVLNDEIPEGPPDDMRSGKGTIGKMKKIDDYTLQLIFDAPAPVTPERLAAWVNRGIGPTWMAPKHYAKQFHKKYNPNVKKNWTEDFAFPWGKAVDFTANPDCPTMTGWKLKEYKKGQYSIWERNPYYWCIDKWGNQLPYIDNLIMRNILDPEVLKLKFTQGAADFVHGGFEPISPADYALLKQSEQKGDYQMIFWDSGSGTGSIFFFNHDYPDAKMRELIRNPKFKQALSHAYNREAVRKLVYLDTGEVTTGTLSPKGVNFNINDEGRKLYEQWRDSYLEYNPDKAKQILDEIGVVDKDGDGWREMPDGSKLVVYLDYQADTPQGGEHMRKNEQLAADWKAIGINAKLNPIPPTGWGDRWNSGKLMSTTTWEVGDNSILIYPGWVVPVEPAHWAPLHGAFFQVIGTPKQNQQKNINPWKRNPPRIGPFDKEFFEPVKTLWDLYNKARVEVDRMKRISLEWQIMKLHIEQGPFFLGVVANWPRVELVKNGLKNVPRREDLTLHGWVNPWIHPTPAVYDPETWYWENPEQHQMQS